ncbi:MAG: hypothetical protein KTR20_03545 [Cellvibrionaceae bacterium]|nr:hypothetical protein [Cellvibrionaceae bacterium]
MLMVAMSWASSERFPDVDLWVPTAYQHQFLRLLAAAEKAQAAEYCHTLLSGRLLESQSTPERPLFSFRCRTDQRKLFTVKVDGVTLAVTNTYLERQRELQAQADAEAQRQEAARLAALHEEQKHYWGICRQAIKQRLKLFKQVEILTAMPPIAEIKEETQVRFMLAFDARSPANKPLHYQVICDIEGLDDYSVKLKRRKLPR